MLAAVFFSILTLAPLSADAAVFRAGEQFGLGGDEYISENVYAAGANVRVEGTVDGDVTVAGSQVTVTGAVTEDVNVAGALVAVTGSVGGDVRAAGSQIVIDGPVGGEVLVFGAIVSVLPGAEIRGDFLAPGAAKVVINGTVYGNVLTNAAELEVNGIVHGSINANVDSLVFGEDAQVLGEVSYRSPAEAFVSPGARVPEKMEYMRMQDPRTAGHALTNVAKAVMTLVSVLALVMFVVTGLLAVTLYPARSTELLQATIDSFALNVITGFVALFGVPILLMTIFGTIIGVPIAVFGALLYGIGLFIAKVYAGILLGSLVFLFLKPQKLPKSTKKTKTPQKKTLEVDWKSVLVGVPLLFLLGVVPILGWLIDFVLFWAVLGAVLMMMYEQLWVRRQ